MSWNFEKPLVTMSDAATNEADKKLWEKEDLGGITEDNNRLPMPVVLLVVLTIFTAFAVTFPLWGQRPTAELYAGYVKSMNTPEVMAIQNDDEAMKKIVQMNRGGGTMGGRSTDDMLDRHPLTMNDLRIIGPEITRLQAAGVDLGEYSVVGDRVVLANFEGNIKADGTHERKQPWWDKGYTIDIFYLSYFFIMVILLVKRLPPSTWQPRHNNH
jgi:hypothetical protein